MKNYIVTAGIFENTIFRGKVDCLNKRVINIDTIGQSYPLENCKEMIKKDVCKLTYSVNRTFVKEPIIKADGSKFVIEKPTNFRLSCLSPSNMEKVTDIFKNLELMHSVKYYPSGYFKNQKTPLYDIKIDLGYGSIEFECNLLDFGNSFGSIEFEGTEFLLSHSGGTGGDYTDMFTITGKQVEFAKLIQSKFLKVRN